MRFKLKLELQGEPPYVMPANYQYELAECINKIIHFDDKAFSQKLEKDGYLNENKQFDFFSFSSLDLKNHRQEEDRLITDEPEADMLFSILVDDDIGQHAAKLFTGKEMRFGDKKNKISLKVKSADLQPEPKFSGSMDFKLLSPLLITDDSGGNRNIFNNKTKILSPDDKEYERLFIKSLMTKYALLMKSVKSGFASTINSNFSKLKFKCTSKPVSKIIRINSENSKPVSVKGYLFDFNLTAPEELIKLGYYSGFGEYNNYGFGFCISR